jgi:hypothetical protein
MVSEEAIDCGLREGWLTSCLRGDGPRPSFEDVITLSDSLSLSSYSSWLLFSPAFETLCPVATENCPPPRARLGRLCRFESCWTVRPVVMISSATDDREAEDGQDPISTHDSRESGIVSLLTVDFDRE